MKILTAALIVGLAGLPAATRVSATSHNALRFLGFHHQLPPLNDLRVRTAIARAIDRRALTAMVSDAEFATGIQPPGAPLTWRRDVDPFPYSPDAAKQLLGQAALGQLTLSFYAGRNVSDMANRIAQGISAVGIQVNTTLVGTFEELAVAVKSGRAHLFLAGSFVDSRATDERRTVLLWDFSSKGANFDLYHYRNTRVDEHLEQALLTSDPTRKTSLYRQAEEALLADVAIVPIFFFHAR